MLAMLEPATCKQHGQVDIRMRVGAAHAGAIKHHGALQQRLPFFLSLAQAIEEAIKYIELAFFFRAQFCNHFWAVTMMGNVMNYGGIDKQ